MGVLDLLLPDRCVGCGGDGGPFCSSCRGDLSLLQGPLCDVCGAPVAWPVARCSECSGRRLAFACARAAVGYEGVTVRLVSSWKGGRRSLARVAADLVTECLACPAVAAITFVPAVPGRALWRGHNPAERLARELGASWRLPVLELLTRGTAPRPQRGLSSADRRRNVAGAFRSRPGVPASIALVDDVYTTGATVNEAASTLRRGGGRRVEVITFARALRP